MATLPLAHLIAESSTKEGEVNVTEQTYGQGVTQRAVYGTSAKRDSWTVKWVLLNKQDRDLLWSFYNTVGTVTAYEWQAPSDSVIKEWWFKEPPKEKQHKGDRFTITATIMQYNNRQVPVRILGIEEIK